MLKVERPDLLLTQAPDDWLEIIGVVGDVRNDGSDHPTKPAVFLPYSFVLTPDDSCSFVPPAIPRWRSIGEEAIARGEP